MIVLISQTYNEMNVVFFSIKTLTLKLKDIPRYFTQEHSPFYVNLVIELKKSFYFSDFGSLKYFL